MQERLLHFLYTVALLVTKSYISQLELLGSWPWQGRTGWCWKWTADRL